MADPEPYEIPPAFEPDASQIPAWADDIDRFRIMFALTMLIAGKYDPLFTKQLYDDPRMLSDDVPLADPKRTHVHRGESPPST